MNRFIEREIEDAIAEKMIEAFPNSLSGVAVSVSDGDIKISTL